MQLTQTILYRTLGNFSKEALKVRNTYYPNISDEAFYKACNAIRDEIKDEYAKSEHSNQSQEYYDELERVILYSMLPTLFYTLSDSSYFANYSLYKDYLIDKYNK